MLLPIIMILVCVLLGGGTLLFLKFSEKRKKAKSRDKEELAQMTANEFVNVKDIRGSFLYTRDGMALAYLKIFPISTELFSKNEKAFMTNADTWTVETWDNSILCIGRYFEGEKIYGLFNFSEYDKTAWINERDGLYKDLITGQEMEAAGVNVPAYGFFWLKKK